jgi:hypothetical protein
MELPIECGIRSHNLLGDCCPSLPSLSLIIMILILILITITMIQTKNQPRMHRWKGKMPAVLCMYCICRWKASIIEKKRANYPYCG